MGPFLSQDQKDEGYLLGKVKNDKDPEVETWQQKSMDKQCYYRLQ